MNMIKTMDWQSELKLRQWEQFFLTEPVLKEAWEMERKNRKLGPFGEKSLHLEAETDSAFLAVRNVLTVFNQLSSLLEGRELEALLSKLSMILALYNSDTFDLDKSTEIIEKALETNADKFPIKRVPFLYTSAVLPNIGDFSEEIWKEFRTICSLEVKCLGRLPFFWTLTRLNFRSKIELKSFRFLVGHVPFKSVVFKAFFDLSESRDVSQGSTTNTYEEIAITQGLFYRSYKNGKFALWNGKKESGMNIGKTPYKCLNEMHMSKKKTVSCHEIEKIEAGSGMSSNLLEYKTNLRDWKRHLVKKSFIKKTVSEQIFVLENDGKIHIFKDKRS